MPKMNFITIKIICLKPPPGNPIVASVKIITVKFQTPPPPASKTNRGREVTPKKRLL